MGSSQGSGTTPEQGDDSGSYSGGGSVTEPLLIANYADHSNDTGATGDFSDGIYGKYGYTAQDSGYVSGYTPNEANIVASVRAILEANASDPSDIASYVESPKDVCLGKKSYNLLVYNNILDSIDGVDWSDGIYKAPDPRAGSYIYDYNNDLNFSPVLNLDGTPEPDHDFVGYIAHFTDYTGDSASFELAYDITEAPSTGTMSLLLEDTERKIGLFRLNKRDDVVLAKPLYFVGKTDKIHDRALD